MRIVEFDDKVNPQASDYPDEYIHEIQRHVKRDENGKKVKDAKGSFVYVNAVVLDDAPKEDAPRVKSLLERIEDIEVRLDKAEKI
jgi:hypothetical protein